MKSNKPDFRRETENIFQTLSKDNKISTEEIARLMQKSVFTIYRWKEGKTSPSRVDFQRLKQLISADPKLIAQSGGGGDKSMSMLEVGMMIGEMKKSFEMEMGKMRSELREIKKRVGLPEEPEGKQ